MPAPWLGDFLREVGDGTKSEKKRWVETATKTSVKVAKAFSNILLKFEISVASLLALLSGTQQLPPEHNRRAKLEVRAELAVEISGRGGGSNSRGRGSGVRSGGSNSSSRSGGKGSGRSGGSRDGGAGDSGSGKRFGSRDGVSSGSGSGVGSGSAGNGGRVSSRSVGHGGSKGQ